jgi:hypothetical protein
MQKIFATCHLMSACRWWNEKHTIKKTWTQFKSYFAAAHRQHKQMQGESADTAGYHSANAAFTHNEDQMAEATIQALANLATATAADRGVMCWQLSHRSNPVLPISWRTTQLSCGNSRLYSRRNVVKSVANAASTPHPAITVGRMDTQLVLVPQVRPAHKYPNSPWEMIHPPAEIMQYVCDLTRSTRLDVLSHSQPLVNAKYQIRVTNYL